MAEFVLDPKLLVHAGFDPERISLVWRLCQKTDVQSASAVPTNEAIHVRNGHGGNTDIELVPQYTITAQHAYVDNRLELANQRASALADRCGQLESELAEAKREIVGLKRGKR